MGQDIVDACGVCQRFRPKPKLGTRILAHPHVCQLNVLLVYIYTYIYTYIYIYVCLYQHFFKFDLQALMVNIAVSNTPNFNVKLSIFHIISQ